MAVERLDLGGKRAGEPAQGAREVFCIRAVTDRKTTFRRRPPRAQRI
jgi:hypothetical protein